MKRRDKAGERDAEMSISYFSPLFTIARWGLNRMKNEETKTSYFILHPSSFSLSNMTTSRYLVGIDLGTTNSAVAYINSHQESPSGAPAKARVRTFPIPQLIAEGKVATRPLLPSFLY